MGFMSDFHQYMKDLEAYQAANGGPTNAELTVLVVRDWDEKYGDNFYVCLTAEAREREFSAAREEEAAAAAAKAAEEAAAAAAAAAEYARLNAVFEDKPLVTRAYTSATAAATADEVVGLRLSERPLAAFAVTRPRSSFGGRCPTFGPRDSDTDAKQAELRPVKNPDFDLRLRLRDCGLQGAPPTKAAAAQTSWFAPVAAAVQYAGFDEAARRGAPDARLLAFLAKALRPVERALQENEGVDIFRDAFARLGGDDHGAEQGKGEGGLTELRTFNDIRCG